MQPVSGVKKKAGGLVSNLSRHFTLCSALLLLFMVIATPTTGVASVNPEVQKAINLLKQKEYVQALDLLQEIRHGGLLDASAARIPTLSAPVVRIKNP